MHITPTKRISIDESLRVGIQRTLRIPDDGRTYPLPPALGRLAIRAASDYPAPTAQGWRDGAHFIAPMHAREAAWLQFDARRDAPRAVKIGVGHVDALTGLEWDHVLRASPQNYIVCPYQPWLDGFKVGPALVRQFVAVPLGTGATVEHQLTGRESGGIVIAAFRPRPGALDARTLPEPTRGDRARELAMGAGGRITQRIYPDPLGFDVWDTKPSAILHLHLIDAREYETATGESVPPSPVDAQTYSRFGLPWFEVYDASRGDIPATSALANITPVGEPAGTPSDDTPPGEPSAPTNVRPIPPRSRRRT